MSTLGFGDVVFAGCQHVIQLGEMLGRSFARRVFGRDGRSHVIAAAA